MSFGLFLSEKRSFFKIYQKTRKSAKRLVSKCTQELWEEKTGIYTCKEMCEVLLNYTTVHEVLLNYTSDQCKEVLLNYTSVQRSTLKLYISAKKYS